MQYQTEHKKDCPTQWRPPRKPGKCLCGVERDKWLRQAAQLSNAIKRSAR